MTEVAIPESSGLSTLGQWAMDAQQAHQVAQALAKTTFVPKHYQGKPAEITACVLAGQELGIEPMAALRSIAIIQGTPALTAVALRALVQGQGHEVWISESTATKAVAHGRRKGSDVEHKSTWTIDRAKALGLTGRDNWTKQPEAMLVARATSEVCRLVAADAVLGLAYSVEELSDSAPARRTSTRAKRAPLEVPAPELEAAPAVEEPAEAEAGDDE